MLFELPELSSSSLFESLRIELTQAGVVEGATISDLAFADPTQKLVLAGHGFRTIGTPPYLNSDGTPLYREWVSERFPDSRRRQGVFQVVQVAIEVKTGKILLVEVRESADFVRLGGFQDAQSQYFSTRARLEKLGVLDLPEYRDGTLPPPLARLYGQAFDSKGNSGGDWGGFW